MVTIRELGPAILGFPLVGASALNGRLYLVSRNLVPAQLATYDIATRSVTSTVSIPEGAGAWGTTAAQNRYVYIGMFGARGRPNLYRLDQRTAQLEAVALLDVEYQWAWDAADDGLVYGVTAPDRVLRYDPVAQRADELPLISPPRDRVRSVAVSGNELWVGGSRDGRAHLVVADRTTLAAQPALPAGLAQHQQVYVLTADAGLIALGTAGPGGQQPALALIDRAGAGFSAVVTLPDEAIVDALTITDVAVFATARRSGSLYRWDLRLRQLRKVSTPVTGAETRTIVRHGNELVGVSSAGQVWHSNLTNEQVEVVDVIAAGAVPRPELPQSMAVGGGRLFVGANFGMAVRDLPDGAPRRRFVPGEPKDLLYVDGTLYLALYPSAQLWRYDPATQDLRLAVQLPVDQNRPVSLAWDAARARVLIGTASDKDGGGALCTYSPFTGRVVADRDPLRPGQHVGGLAAAGGVAYLGGSGTSPAFGAWDIARRRLRWSVDVVAPDGGTVTGVAVSGGVVVAWTLDGTLVAYSTATGAELARRDLPHGGGRLVARAGVIYGASLNRLLRIDPQTLAVTQLVGALQARIWGWPFLTVDEGGTLYAIKGSGVIAVRE